MRHHPEVETRSTGKRSLPGSAPSWVRDELAEKREARPSEDRGLHGGGGLTINEPATYEKGGRSFFADLETGEPMIASQVYSRYASAKAAAGVRPDLRFHDLRHTFGTMMASQGVPMTAIKSWMGHANLETTERYAKYAPTPEHDRHAIDAAFQVDADLPAGTRVGTSEAPIPTTTGH